MYNESPSFPLSCINSNDRSVSPNVCVGDVALIPLLACWLVVVLLPVLLNRYQDLKKVVLNGVYQPMPTMYTEELCHVVDRLLQLDSKARPHSR